ncbi:MAG TPA: DEAD/DEAH box helicase, partial [Mobilitalea sp.]|nr:DEAD/DEAH box helicase [Mobilitalea sp.]
EYTGRVRRGYFIEGLSGIQFIRDKDFAGIMLALEQPREDILWLSAIDSAQPWGKSLPHLPGRAFINVPGTMVALHAGLPVAVFERQGKVLRVFDDTFLTEALRIFVEDYAKRSTYSSLNRMMVKEYPKEAAEALALAGFMHEMQDYVLYRSSI